MEITELAGLAGAVLAGTAYMPQITHLVRARCSAGISRLAFGIWLLSSVLVLLHAVAIGAGVFILLGAIQIAAIAVIIFCSTIYAGSYCDSHLPAEDPAGRRLGNRGFSPDAPGDRAGARRPPAPGNRSAEEEPAGPHSALEDPARPLVARGA